MEVPPETDTGEPYDEEAETARFARRRRRRAVVPIAAAIGVGLLLVLPLVLNLGWAPVAHWVCLPGPRLLSETFYSPGVVANSPYGGQVWANGTFPWNPTQITGAGGNESNGGSFADLSTANFSIYPARNDTTWGPGPNGRCTTPYLVDVARSFSVEVKLLALLPEGTTNDANAPVDVAPWDANDSSSVIFGDRFLASNTDAIDTCLSSSPVERSISASTITVGLPVRLPDGGATVPVTLPVTTTLHYWFPAHFGIWLLDDLSANGYLPGAGLAFEFHNCS